MQNVVKVDESNRGHRGILNSMLWMRGNAYIENGWIIYKPDPENSYSPDPSPAFRENSPWFDLAYIGKELVLGQTLDENRVLTFVQRHGLLRNGIQNPRAFEIAPEILPLRHWRPDNERCPYSKDFLCERIIDWFPVAKAFYEAIFIHFYLAQSVQTLTQKTDVEIRGADNQLREIHTAVCFDLSQYYPHVFSHVKDSPKDEDTVRRDLSQVVSMIISSGLQDAREQVISAANLVNCKNRVFEDTHGILNSENRPRLKRAGGPGDFVFSLYCPDLLTLIFWQLAQHVMVNVPMRLCPCNIIFQPSRKDQEFHNDACRQRFGRAKRLK